MSVRDEGGRNWLKAGQACSRGPDTVQGGRAGLGKGETCPPNQRKKKGGEGGWWLEGDIALGWLWKEQFLSRAKRRIRKPKRMNNPGFGLKAGGSCSFMA